MSIINPTLKPKTFDEEEEKTEYIDVIYLKFTNIRKSFSGFRMGSRKIIWIRKETSSKFKVFFFFNY